MLTLKRVNVVLPEAAEDWTRVPDDFATGFAEAVTTILYTDADGDVSKARWIYIRPTVNAGYAITLTAGGETWALTLPSLPEALHTLAELVSWLTGNGCRIMPQSSGAA
ncbi:hypothetical protein ABZ470_31800 [Streptosporangium sp. NPDC020072]|uniref:hypothetical protein n=1 Tax=Streptosporangium sp. NPDC020072 TaxID=3154788 RepID=UPI00343DF402